MGDDERVWRERGLREAVLAGDARAWQTWYDESFAALDAYVLWRCGGLRDLADEIVQDSWLVAVRRVGHFDPEQAAFASWLRGIAANVVRNHWRGRRMSRPLVPQIADVRAGDELRQRELCERIARALAELPERYETVLRAKYLDQKSVAEIAAEVLESPKAIESLLTRARNAFRTAFGTPE
jgi:RNA polymerase sigma-70 factor (ECF subfamily)